MSNYRILPDKLTSSRADVFLIRSSRPCGVPASVQVAPGFVRPLLSLTVCPCRSDLARIWHDLVSAAFDT
jgi:hypothetical protein